MTLPPLGTTKETAHRILAREKREIYYAELARLVANELNLPLSDKEMRSLAEDIREKCLQAGAYGMAYIARPYCVGVLQEWFADRPLLNVDSERVFIDEAIAVEAAKEGMLRFEHILNKQGTSDEDRAEVIARGLLIEKAVVHRIKSRWPQLYRDPVNHRRYNQPCGHDGRLQLRSFGLVTFDVAGPNRYDEYGAVANKPSADLHILAEAHGLSAVIRGVESSNRFRFGRFSAEQAQSWSKLVAMLNMEAGQYGYLLLSQAFVTLRKAS